MKLKFQRGGFMLPATPYTPVTSTPIEASYNFDVLYQPTSFEVLSKKKDPDSNKESGTLTQKDLFQMLEKIDGLHSDMLIVTSLFLKLYKDLMFLNNGKLDSSQIASLYLNGLQKVKEAKLNKELFKEAYDTVKENKGLNEIAINKYGELAIQNNGKVQFISANEYLKEPEKYQSKLLSNSDLLSLRDKYLAFNNDLLPVVENGIGLEKVSSLINDLSKGLGKTQLKEEGYSETESNDIKGGLQYIKKLAKQGVDISGMTLDGIYKSTIITENQKEQIRSALSYIYNGLPLNAKTLLQIKNGSKDGAVNHILRMLEGQASNKFEYSLSREKEKDSESKGNKIKVGPDGKLIDMEDFGPTSSFISGFGLKNSFLISDGTKDGLKVDAILDSVRDSEGKPMGDGTLLDFNKSSLKGNIDISQATFGGMFLDLNALNQVIYQGDVASVDMLIDVELFNKTGQIRPDISLLSKKTEVDKKIRAMGIKEDDFDSINKIYRDNGLPLKYNNGKLSGEYRRFAVLHATTTTKALKDQYDPIMSKYVKELSGIEEENALNNIKRYMNEKEAKEFIKSYDEDNWYDFDGHDNVLEGNVYIPLNDNVLASTYSDKTKLTYSQAKAIDNAVYRNQKLQEAYLIYKPAGGLKL